MPFRGDPPGQRAHRAWGRAAGWSVRVLRAAGLFPDCMITGGWGAQACRLVAVERATLVRDPAGPARRVQLVADHLDAGGADGERPVPGSLTRTG